MTKTTLTLDKLKPQALNATGRQVYGLDEYIYIKSFSYDDNNVITINYYELLKTSETQFDLISKSKYSIADGKAFMDSAGYLVYKEVDGVVQYEDVTVTSTNEDGTESSVTTSEPIKRQDDFSRNFVAFAALIIPSIFLDVNNHLGYHANEAGAVDSPIEV